jgi:hypothetical protein
MLKKLSVVIILVSFLRCSAYSSSPGLYDLLGEAADILTPHASRAMSSLISAQETHFTETVGYAPVRIQIINDTPHDMVLTSLTVTSGKVVSPRSCVPPREMLLIPKHDSRAWQVSSRVGAMIGPEGQAVYSSVDGRHGWVSFTWDCGVGTGCKLHTKVDAGGVEHPAVRATCETGSGLSGLSNLTVKFFY